MIKSVLNSKYASRAASWRQILLPTRSRLENYVVTARADNVNLVKNLAKLEVEPQGTKNVEGKVRFQSTVANMCMKVHDNRFESLEAFRAKNSWNEF